MVQTTSRAQSLIFSQIPDGDGGELLCRVFDEVAENRFIIVADDVDLLNLLVGNAGDSGQTVPNDGVSGDLEQRLGEVERKRAETGTTGWTTDLSEDVKLVKKEDNLNPKQG